MEQTTHIIVHMPFLYEGDISLIVPDASVSLLFLWKRYKLVDCQCQRAENPRNVLMVMLSPYL